MTEPDRHFDAEQARDLLTTMNTLLKPLLAREGVAVFADPQHLAQAREVFYAARSSTERVTERPRNPYGDGWIATKDEWLSQVRAMRALGSLLRLFDEQIPQGIPEPEQLITDDLSDRLEALDRVMDETRQARSEVYRRTINANGPHTLTSQEILAFERVTQAVNNLLDREGPNM